MRVKLLWANPGGAVCPEVDTWENNYEFGRSGMRGVDWFFPAKDGGVVYPNIIGGGTDLSRRRPRAEFGIQYTGELRIALDVQRALSIAFGTRSGSVVCERMKHEGGYSPRVIVTRQGTAPQGFAAAKLRDYFGTADMIKLACAFGRMRRKEEVSR